MESKLFDPDPSLNHYDCMFYCVIRRMAPIDQGRPVEATDPSHHEDEVYQHLMEAIVNGDIDAPVFDELPIEHQGSILQKRDDSGHNPILKAIHCANVPILVRLLRQTAADPHNLKSLLSVPDNQGRNVLHLALQSHSTGIFQKVWEHLKAIERKKTVYDWILQKSHDNNNVLTIALKMGMEGRTLLHEYFLPCLELSHNNIMVILNEDIIVRAIQTNNFEVAQRLVNDVKIHSGVYRDKMLTNLFVNKVHQEEVNCTVNASEVDTHSQTVGKNLIEILVVLIKNDCQKLVTALLINKWFANLLWIPMHREAPKCRFSRKSLESHPMTSEMVAAFNNSSSKFYLNLTDQSKARQLCLLFYTKEHTAKYTDKHRHGASEECAFFKHTLEYTGVTCIEMPENGKVWSWKELQKWLDETLDLWKCHVSHLIIAGCCHGLDGLLSDSDMAPCPLSTIIKLVNGRVYKRIPKTFIFQGCRIPIGLGGIPTMKLERDNLVIMTCAEGQQSIRGVYAKRFAQKIRYEHVRDIQHIHADMANEMKNDDDSRIRDLTPELRHELTKRELSLPLPKTNE